MVCGYFIDNLKFSNNSFCFNQPHKLTKKLAKYYWSKDIKNIVKIHRRLFYLDFLFLYNFLVLTLNPWPVHQINCSSVKST